MFPFQGGQVPTFYAGGNTPPPQGVYEESVKQLAPLGSRLNLDQRWFVYCKNGGVALGKGKLVTAAIMVALHIDIPCVVANSSTGVGVAGQNKLQVTLGATAATVNQYAEGWVNFNDNGQEGRTQAIKRHPAADASATLILDLHDKLVADAAVADQVHLEASPFKAVVIGTGAITDFPVGVPQIAVTIAYYFWAQYWGPGAVLAEANPPVLGTTCGASGTTGGALEVREAVEVPQVGTARVLGVSTEYSPVWLSILI